MRHRNREQCYGVCSVPSVVLEYERDKYEKGRQEEMKRFGDTAAGKMEAQDLYPPRKWIRASDILEQPFVLIRANTGKAQNGNPCAYLTVNFQRIPPHITDHSGEKINRYDEYAISHQGAKIIGRISHMKPDDYPCGPVCFVAVSTPGSQSKSHDLWDYEELEALQQQEQLEDNPFMDELEEIEPEQATEQKKSTPPSTRYPGTSSKPGDRSR